MALGPKVRASTGMASQRQQTAHAKGVVCPNRKVRHCNLTVEHLMLGHSGPRWIHDKRFSAQVTGHVNAPPVTADLAQTWGHTNALVACMCCRSGHEQADHNGQSRKKRDAKHAAQQARSRRPYGPGSASTSAAHRHNQSQSARLSSPRGRARPLCEWIQCQRKC